MAKHPTRLWIMVLLLGWAFDFLYWRQPAGTNFAIFVSLCVLGGFFLLLINGIKPSVKSLWLILPFVFFAIITIVRKEPVSLFLGYAFALVSLGVLAATYLGGRWMQYSLSDYFKKFFLLLGSVISRPLDFIIQIRKERAERGEAPRRPPIWPVVRGLAIALPIVIFFAALLVSADMVYSSKLQAFFELFDAGRIFEYTVRLFIILFWAYVLAGIYLHAAAQSQDEKLLGEDKPTIKPFLGFTETAIVLGSVIVLFLSFVIVQFQYFFGGRENIGIAGYTYSEYARSGFNELVAVAFFSLLLTLGLSTITKRENESQRRAYSGLSIAIVVLVMVILVSAYQRLNLAIDWHGFSRLRLYPRVFLIWVGILFVTVVVLEILRRERFIALAIVLASLGFALSLTLYNVDAAIVHRNVLRSAQGMHFNVNYLTSLTTDAVPALADEFMDPTLPTATREGVGAALLCFQHSRAIANASGANWRSFDFSGWAALWALYDVRDALQGYNVNTGRSPVRVRTPGNVLYDCAR